jgi:type IV pilus assembly protein PilC
MLYRYVGYSENKKVVRGTIESVSAKEAEDSLYKAGFQRIIELEKTGSNQKWREMVFGAPTVSKQELLDFTNELAVLVESGLTLLVALKQLEKQSSRRGFQSVMSELVTALLAGKQLHEAMVAHPNIFPETYTSIIAASEQSGTLDTGLRQIAKELRLDINTKAQIQKAIIQPAIVLVVAIGVVILMATVVLPNLLTVFKDMGVELPWITRALIAVVDFINNYKFAILLIIVIAIVAIIFMWRQKETRRAADRLMLRLPVVGNLILWNATARLSRTMAILLKAGILLPETINIIMRTIGNSTIREALDTARVQLLQGQTLSGVLGGGKIFPQLLVEMVSVGETSGQLESTLETVADYFEVKTERNINRLTSMLEPAMILGIGVVVAIIAISLVSTIYGLVGSFPTG